MEIVLHSKKTISTKFSKEIVLIQLEMDWYMGFSNISVSAKMADFSQ